MTIPRQLATPACEPIEQKATRCPARIFNQLKSPAAGPVAGTPEPLAGTAPECIFVTGVMRSGTTILQRIVAHSLSTDYIRQECSLRIPVESFQVLERHQAYAPMERADYVEQYQRFLSGLLATMRGRIGGELVLKDPLALNTLLACHELMPRTKFIISIRNPMSTAASIYRVRNRQRQQGKSSFIAPMDFGDIVEYIARLCDIIISLREKDNVCMVKYEELVGRDPTALARLGSFIGASVKLDLPDDSAAYDPEHAFWTPESGQELLTSSLDKYQAELSTDETALVASKLARFNALFAYD
ncbi:MAG: sulfotransferase [Pseudomonadota bacterium]